MLTFNKRHREALKYYANHPNEAHYTPYGIGEGTMDSLVQYGYVTRDRAWFGYMYKITDKGIRTVGQWVPDDVQKRLDKWNNNAGDKR